jgi:amino acid efflux transporter
MSNVAEEFQNPKRDFHRSIVISVFVIGALYVSVAFATVGTLAYKGAGSAAPFAAIASNILGPYGAAGTAILAIFIDFGAVNAYTTGLSRVIYVVARDGGFPKFLDHLDDKTRVPDRSLLTLSGLSLLMLGAFYVLEVNLQVALLVTSGAAIMIYAIGSGAGIRLLRGGTKGKILPWVAFLISLGVLPFVGLPLSLCVIAAVLGLIYSWMVRHK